MCENLGIRTPVRLEIVIRVNTIYGYHYRASTRLKYQRFENRLKDKPGVRTPIRRSLVEIHQAPFCHGKCYIQKLR